ncbi:hypothetical protein [Thiohalomonas denitrificans]|uniref:NnrS protein n=1 Tax=Thiohalomonas denitrificans TaxID=415747 RepID=A0A1G5QJT8_9GAMM|nr:hypothetical protein [Thiohalomonas denitrificans]SCZ62125.1 hypothetical protein SAMN03097708_02263 [Thiohalomonas denitrificans]
MIARDLPPVARLPLLVLGFLSLAFGVIAGLVRLGWPLPLPSPELLGLHGPLMVSGFFGTVIGLERAVALASRWAYGGPALTGAGGLALIAGAPMGVASSLLSAGSLVLVAASWVVVRRQRALFTLTLAAGAAVWSVGNLLWLAGAPVADVLPWWAGFLVLTIAGERLELSRFRPASAPARWVFAAVALLLLAGIGTSSFSGAGRMVLAASLLLLALWLGRYDVALYTVRGSGLPRFTAVCLLSGYVWLAVGAVVGLSSGGLFFGYGYDTTLHSVFLGFVFAMVFGHAPIIFPAVTRFNIPYHPVFYLHLVLLHATLGLRVAGDLGGWMELRRIGGLGNALVLLLFVANTVAAVIKGRRAAS